MIDTYRIRLPDSRDPIPFENRSDRLEEARLVFLMGCPRSGTTFILSCLAALPRAQARDAELHGDEEGVPGEQQQRQDEGDAHGASCR